MAKNLISFNRLRAILTDTKTIILGVIVGVLIGIFHEPTAKVLTPYGQIYIQLLSMCVIPIMITAIVSGIGSMLRDPQLRALFGPIAFYYVAGLLVPCLVGIAVALILQPGSGLEKDSAAILGKALGASPGTKEAGGLLAMISQMIPHNIFEALSSGKFMSIVFFCLLFGIALGVVESDGADATLKLIETINAAFIVIFNGVLVGLPFGLACIVAHALSIVDAALLGALGKYVLMFYIASLIIILIYTVLGWWAARGSPIRTLTAFRSPLIMAFASDNPFVAMYPAIEILKKEFKVNRRVADSIMPFGIIANQHGGVLLLVFLSIFLSQVYGVTLTLDTLIIIGIGCILSGPTAIGAGAVLAPIVAPILVQAGIPSELAIVVLVTMDPIIAPMRSLLTVMGNTTLTLLTARQETMAARNAAPKIAAKET